MKFRNCIVEMFKTLSLMFAIALVVIGFCYAMIESRGAVGAIIAIQEQNNDR